MSTTFYEIAGWLCYKLKLKQEFNVKWNEYESHQLILRVVNRRTSTIEAVLWSQRQYLDAAELKFNFLTQTVSSKLMTQADLSAEVIAAICRTQKQTSRIIERVNIGTLD